MATTNSTAILAPGEIARLEQLEGTIKTGITTFINVGLALAEIRDAKLYRQTHTTFQSYCKDKWGFTRQRAYQLIGAAEVAGTLECKPRVDIPEKAFRLLAPIPTKEKRQEVYNKAVEIAGDGPVTTSDVAAARASPPWVEAAVVEPKDDITKDTDTSDDYEDPIPQLVENAAGAGKPRIGVTALKALLKALTGLRPKFERYAEFEPIDFLCNHLSDEVYRLKAEAAAKKKAATPVVNYRCPDCEQTWPEDELVSLRECSRESCGHTFVATEGNSCPECNMPFTRVTHELACPECGSEEECIEVEDEPSTEAVVTMAVPEPEPEPAVLHHGRRVLAVDEHGPLVVAKAVP